MKTAMVFSVMALANLHATNQSTPNSPKLAPLRDFGKKQLAFTSQIALVENGTNAASLTQPQPLQAAQKHSSEIDPHTIIFAWIPLGISALNFLIVAALFAFNLCDRRKRSRYEAMTFWIQKIILEPKREMIEGFFKDCAEYLQPIHVPENGVGSLAGMANARMQTFKRSIAVLRHEVVEPLEWLHVEFGKLDDVVNQAQDDVTDAINRIPGNETLDISEAQAQKIAFSQYKRDFYKVLISAQSKATNLNLTPAARVG